MRAAQRANFWGSHMLFKRALRLHKARPTHRGTGRTSYCMRAACGLGPAGHSFFSHQNYMYMYMCMRLSDRSHRTAGWVAAAHVHQMCTARLCGSHKNLSPSRPVVNWRSLNLYITLLRSQPRGAAIADRRHELGGALSAGAVAGEQCNRGIMRDRGIM